MSGEAMEQGAVRGRGECHGQSLRRLLAQSVPDIEVTDLTLDSRDVRPGAAFIALPGAHTHGIRHAAQAAAAGARAILWEPAGTVVPPTLPPEVALLAIPRLREQLGALADRWFGAPSRALRVVGVTGTNGKTTTAHLIADALERLGERSAYAGTLGTGHIGALREATHTTPDCITVHRRLAELRDAGVRSLAMEVSSHALDQHRVDGVCFDTAVFTNLSRDHLDYHGTLEAYGAAKAKLFAWPSLRHAVINVDDPHGHTLALAVRDQARAQLVCCSRAPLSAVSFAAEGGATSGSPACAGVRHLYAASVIADPSGLRIEVDGSWGAASLCSRLIGDFNVDNVLAALATLLVGGVPLLDAVAALERCTAPPGRMEALTVAGRPLVIIDYSHTPDALEKALLAVRSHGAGRLICVFGCGGDRDPGKRPLMGAIAERLADGVIVTDDNPRSEDGDAIVAAILGGMSDRARAQVERDRAAAIRQAICGSGAHDVVVIAGKGHEEYQIVGAERRPFSDREVASAALAAGGVP